MGYDIIGDIHGHAAALTALLRKMGYREHGGAWRHPDRMAIFIGDLIDRGPGQVETVRIVRGMTDRGLGARGHGQPRVQRHRLAHARSA